MNLLKLRGLSLGRVILPLQCIMYYLDQVSTDINRGHHFLSMSIMSWPAHIGFGVRFLTASDTESDELCETLFSGVVPQSV